MLNSGVRGGSLIGMMDTRGVGELGKGRTRREGGRIELAGGRLVGS